MKTYALIALALTAGLSTAAIAQDNNIDVNADGAHRTATVNIADLNLTNSADRMELHSRLRLAVNAVCGTANTLRDLDSACAATAERDASKQAYAAYNNALAGRVAQSSVVVSGAR